MKISVITVTYNSEKTLEDTIRSVISQKYDNVEHVIMDGGSSDSTLQILDSYSDNLSVVISEPDEGIYDAYNKALKHVSGDIIAILNSDDVFYDNNVLNRVASEFERTGSELVYGDLALVHEDDLSTVMRFWKSSKFIPGSFKHGWHPPHPSFFVKRSVYQCYGNFDLNLPVSADFELMLRFMEVHKCVATYLPHVLTRMRVGGHSQNFRNILKGGRSILSSFKKHGINIHPLFYFAKRYLSKLMQVLFTKNTIIKEMNSSE